MPQMPKTKCRKWQMVRDNADLDFESKSEPALRRLQVRVPKIRDFRIKGNEHEYSK